MIKEIQASETYWVRNEVLRKGKPIETCYFEGDDAKTTTHFGIELNKKIIGIVSVYQANSKLFFDEHQFQIRGMAVLNEFQGNGFGTQLLAEAEKYCFDQKASVIWFNAREKAVPFYEKSGYQTMGNSFEIPEVGTHFVMFKLNEV
jgi:ribosomal protein S18 acetylase RimI-like enzyme